jgi:hypothetical protein
VLRAGLRRYPPYPRLVPAGLERERGLHPRPDELIFLSTFTGGEVFRCGCTFKRGYGKIFYFSPIDQDYPVYHHKDVRRVIANGVEWAHTLRPERTDPVLLRYETEAFWAGPVCGSWVRRPTSNWPASSI